MGSEFKVGDKAPTLPELDVGANDYNKSHDVPDPQFQDPIPIGFEALNNYHEIKRSHMNAVAAFYHPLLLNGNIPGHVTTYLPAGGMEIADNQDATHVTLGMISTARKEVLEGRIRVTYIDADILSDVDPRTASNLKEEGIDPSAKKDQAKKVYYINGENEEENWHWYDATPGGTLKNGEYTPNSGDSGYSGPALKAVHYTVAGDKIRRETPQAKKAPKVDLFDAESGKAPMGKVAFDAVKALLESPPKELAKPGEWDGYYDVDMAAALAVIKAAQSGSEPVEVNLAAFLDVPGQLTQTLIAIACFGMLNAATAIDLLTGKVVFATKAAAKSAVGKIAQMNEDKYVDPLSQTISFYTHGQTSKDDKTDDFYASAAWGWGALEALSTPEEWVSETVTAKIDFAALTKTVTTPTGPVTGQLEFGDFEAQKKLLDDMEIGPENYRAYTFVFKDGRKQLVEIDGGADPKGQPGTRLPLQNWDQIKDFKYGDDRPLNQEELQKFLDEQGETIVIKGANIICFRNSDYLFKAGEMPIILAPRFNGTVTTAPLKANNLEATAGLGATTTGTSDSGEDTIEGAYLTLDEVMVLVDLLNGIFADGEQYVYVDDASLKKQVLNPITGQTEYALHYRIRIPPAKVEDLIASIDQQLIASGYPKDYYTKANHRYWLPERLVDYGFLKGNWNDGVRWVTGEEDRAALPESSDWVDPEGNNTAINIGHMQASRIRAAFLANVLRVYCISDAPKLNMSQAELLDIQSAMSNKLTDKATSWQIASGVGLTLLGLFGSYYTFKKLNQNAMKAGESEETKDFEKAYGTDLRAEVEAKRKKGKPIKVVGREPEVRSVTAAMTTREGKANSVALSGPAGVGKSVIAEYLADLLNLADAGDSDAMKLIPPELRGARLLQLDINKMTANTAYRGQFESRMQGFIEAVRQGGGSKKDQDKKILDKFKDWIRTSPEAIEVILGEEIRAAKAAGKRLIVFIDEVHNTANAGATKEGGGNFWESLKPYLARGEITVLAASTDDEIKMLMKDPALRRRLKEVPVREVSRDVAITLIKDEAVKGVQSKQKNDPIFGFVDIDQSELDPKKNPKFFEKIYDMAPYFHAGARPSCTEQLTLNFINDFYQQWRADPAIADIIVKYERQIQDYDRALNRKFDGLLGKARKLGYYTPILGRKLQEMAVMERRLFLEQLKVQFRAEIGDKAKLKLTTAALEEYLKRQASPALVEIQRNIDLDINDICTKHGFRQSELGYDSETFKRLRTDDLRVEIPRYRRLMVAIQQIKQIIENDPFLNQTQVKGMPGKTRLQVVIEFTAHILAAGDVTREELSGLASLVTDQKRDDVEKKFDAETTADADLKDDKLVDRLENLLTILDPDGDKISAEKRRYLSELIKKILTPGPDESTEERTKRMEAVRDLLLRLNTATIEEQARGEHEKANEDAVLEGLRDSILPELETELLLNSYRTPEQQAKFEAVAGHYNDVMKDVPLSENQQDVVRLRLAKLYRPAPGESGADYAKRVDSFDKTISGIAEMNTAARNAGNLNAEYADSVFAIVTSEADRCSFENFSAHPEAPKSPTAFFDRTGLNPNIVTKADLHQRIKTALETLKAASKLPEELRAFEENFRILTDWLDRNGATAETKNYVARKLIESFNEGTMVLSAGKTWKDWRNQFIPKVLKAADAPADAPATWRRAADKAAAAARAEAERKAAERASVAPPKPAVAPPSIDMSYRLQERPFRVEDVRLMLADLDPRLSRAIIPIEDDVPRTLSEIQSRTIAYLLKEYGPERTRVIVTMIDQKRGELAAVADVSPLFEARFALEVASGKVRNGMTGTYETAFEPAQFLTDAREFETERKEAERREEEARRRAGRPENKEERINEEEKKKTYSWERTLIEMGRR